MTALPCTILRQAGIQSREVKIAGTVALLRDIPQHNCSLQGLDALAGGAIAELAAGRMLPVGSVEFVRRAMALAGKPEPQNMSYPDALRDHLLRDVRRLRAGLVLGHWFVKPTTTKAFTGFVFDTFTDPASLGDHDREQHDAFMALGADEPVWVSEPVTFVSEVRYYVLDGRVLGSARYDDHDDGQGQDRCAVPSPMPDIETVNSMIERMSADREAPIAYALDAGVLSTGETALVEANDAWALGYYSGSLSHEDYLRMLWARWQQIAGVAKPLPEPLQATVSSSSSA